MTSVPQVAPRRNARDGQSDLPLCNYRQLTPPTTTLTPGAREIQRRTRWSAALCNAVAAAWSFGPVEV